MKIDTAYEGDKVIINITLAKPHLFSRKNSAAYKKKPGKDLKNKKHYEKKISNRIVAIKNELPNITKSPRETVHHMMHCEKCKLDVVADKRKKKCQICYSPLQFFSFVSIRNKVVNESDEISTSLKCSKCYRTCFSTLSSLPKHIRNCSTPFLFDKQCYVKLEKKVFQTGLMKVSEPETLKQESVSDEFKKSEIDGFDPSYKFFDDIDIGPEFITEFTIHESTLDQHTSPPYCNKIQSEDDDIEILGEFKSQCHKDSKNFSQELHSQTDSKISKNFKKLKQPLIFSCDHCNYKTIWKGNITKHIQAIHLPRDSVLNKCNKCEKIFLLRSHLLSHYRICTLFLLK